MTDISRFARRLDRVDGITAGTPTMSGSTPILDFSLDWTGPVPVEKHPRRATAVEKSAIIFNEDGTVREYQLRLAPLPKVNHSEGRAKQKLRGVVNRHSDDILSVMLADDGPDSWTPHVQPKNGSSYVDPDTLVSDLIDLWQGYQDRLLSDDVGRL